MWFRTSALVPGHRDGGRESWTPPLPPTHTCTRVHTHTLGATKIASSHLVARKFHSPLDNKQKLLV